MPCLWPVLITSVIDQSCAFRRSAVRRDVVYGYSIGVGKWCIHAPKRFRVNPPNCWQAEKEIAVLFCLVRLTLPSGSIMLSDVDFMSDPTGLCAATHLHLQLTLYLWACTIKSKRNTHTCTHTHTRTPTPTHPPPRTLCVQAFQMHAYYPCTACSYATHPLMQAVKSTVLHVTKHAHNARCPWSLISFQNG